MKVTEKAQGYISKRIRRLRARAGLADRQKAILEEATEGVLRIDESLGSVRIDESLGSVRIDQPELALSEPSTEQSTDRESVVGIVFDRLTSIDTSDYKPW